MHILSWILDPYTTPETGKLPQGWESVCADVFDNFYTEENEKTMAMEELKRVILKSGDWGYVVSQKRKEVEPPDGTHFETPVEYL